MSIQVGVLGKKSDDWSKLEPFFTEDAVYTSVAPAPFGGEYKGRTAVLTQFQNSVNDFDRRFDSRKLEILEGPIKKDGGVWIRCSIIYTLAGAPDCRMENDGWYLVATKGSHRQFKHLTKPGRVTVAGKPGDDVAPGTLNSILKQAELKH